MEERTITNNSAGKRSEFRTFLDKYYSVQFSLNSMAPAYLFKLRDISSNGPCILVKKDSAVLKHLKVGDILNMEYNPPESSGSAEICKTRIRHISTNHQGRFTGHSLVELSIVDKSDQAG